ncbi:MAG: GNAT family N-acetyltransferase [Bacteroidota bacterium]
MFPKVQVDKVIHEITRRLEWSHFLYEVGTFDFYHTYDYHMVNQKDGDRSVLLAYDDGQNKIGLPLVIRKIPGSTYYDATSVYGYPGPISSEIPPDFDNKVFMEGLKEYFERHRIVSVFSRLNPFAAHQESVLRNLGRIVNQRQVVVIDTRVSNEIQRSSYNKRLKTYVNRAEKSCTPLVVEKTIDNIRIFMDLYYKTMDKVGANKKYYFPEDYFIAFFCGHGYESELLQIKDKASNAVISSGILVYANGVAHYHLSGSDSDFLNLSPTKFLIDQMRVLATQRKCTIFNLGGGIGGACDSLFYFKSAFSKDYRNFKLWKYVVMPNAYGQLVRERVRECPKTGFFPEYRSLED